MGALPYLDLPRVRAPGRDVPAGFEEHFQPRAAAGGAGRGRTEITGLLDSDDTRVMLTALRQLGVNVSELDAGRVTVEGVRRFPVESAELFMGNAGTAIRPLTAALALMGGDYKLSGVPRMHERPIGDLGDALNALAPASATWGSRAIRRCISVLARSSPAPSRACRARCRASS